MPFSNGQLVNAADLNNFNPNTIITTGDVTVGDDLAVSGDVTISGTLSVAGRATSSSGRITLTTGVPVTTADVTAATTIFFTPYGGNEIGLFDGSNWANFAFDEISIAVPATMNTMYDVFAFLSGGFVALATNAWTNDTTRATAIALQDGVYVEDSGLRTRRYLGSFRTTGVSGQTEDSAAKRYLWNYANRVDRPMVVIEATNSWTYTTATYRQANAATANQLDFVVGVSEDAVQANVFGMFQQTDVNIQAGVAIGFDSTSAPATNCVRDYVPNWGSTRNMPIKASVTLIPAVGRHTLVWLEISEAGTGTTTFLGDNGGSVIQTAILGRCRA